MIAEHRACARKPLQIEHLHRQRNHNQMRIRCCRSVTEQYIKMSQLTDAQIGHLRTIVSHDRIAVLVLLAF